MASQPNLKKKARSKRRHKKNSKADLHDRTYHSWDSMLQRCYNPKHISYPEYGGRGIHVHDSWRPINGRSRLEAYASFVKDVGVKPSSIHTLDRISANGHYTPANVRWATPKEQGVNKRDTHFVRHPSSGVVIAAATLADELKLTYQVLRARMMKLGTWYQLREEQAKAANMHVIIPLPTNSPRSLQNGNEDLSLDKPGASEPGPNERPEDHS